MTIDFFIPMQPVAKGRPKFARMGGFVRAYTPKGTVSAENYIKFTAANYRPKELLAGPLRLEVIVTKAFPKSMSKKKRLAALPTTKPDADNYGKLVMDALNEIIWVDDSQVVDLRIVKRYGNVPGINVTVEEV